MRPSCTFLDIVHVAPSDAARAETLGPSTFPRLTKWLLSLCQMYLQQQYQNLHIKRVKASGDTCCQPFFSVISKHELSQFVVLLVTHTLMFHYSWADISG